MKKPTAPVTRDTLVEDSGLSTRVRRVIRRAVNKYLPLEEGDITLRTVAKLTDEQLFYEKNFGRVSMREVEGMLARVKLRLRATVVAGQHLNATILHDDAARPSAPPLMIRVRTEAYGAVIAALDNAGGMIGEVLLDHFDNKLTVRIYRWDEDEPVESFPITDDVAGEQEKDHDCSEPSPPQG